MNSSVVYSLLTSIRENCEATVDATLFYENAGGVATTTDNPILTQENDEKNRLKKIAFKQAADNMKTTNTNLTNTNVSYHNLRKLFDLHDQLLDISEIINRTYSSQIVTYITASFVIILFGLFFEAKVSKQDHNLSFLFFKMRG